VVVVVVVVASDMGGSDFKNVPYPEVFRASCCPKNTLDRSVEISFLGFMESRAVYQNSPPCLEMGVACMQKVPNMLLEILIYIGYSSLRQ